MPNTCSFVGGTTRTSQNPKVIFNAVGQYSVSLSGDSGINTRLKVDYINVTHNTGIQIQNLSSNELNFFPNPASGTLYIQLKGSQIGEKCLVEVLNTTGQEVLSQEIINAQSIESLNLMNFASGLYFIKIRTDNQTYTGKVFLK